MGLSDPETLVGEQTQRTNFGMHGNKRFESQHRMRTVTPYRKSKLREKLTDMLLGPDQ